LIGAPGEGRAADTSSKQLRVALPSDADAMQAVWEASNALDDPAGWPRGGWSVAAWATQTRVLLVEERLVGVVAVRAETVPDGAMPARVALDVVARQPDLSALLVQSAIELVRDADAERIRLFVPSRASWTLDAIRAAGFEQVRTIAHMLLPASSPTPPVRDAAGLTVRSIEPGEDEAVLAALNRAWTGTGNFVSITLQMLADDLRGQREGMLLAVDASNRIMATCHAVFDPSEQNPDGGPRAWISNLTADPDVRGRGIARSMLAAGIAHLRARGATSITLGVDANDPAPFTLYQSVGFVISSSLDVWDKALSRNESDR
jgi:ribosomal protein S18 acetylase RimI-like enzyme